MAEEMTGERQCRSGSNPTTEEGFAGAVEMTEPWQVSDHRLPSRRHRHQPSAFTVAVTNPGARILQTIWLAAGPLRSLSPTPAVLHVRSTCGARKALGIDVPVL